MTNKSLNKRLSRLSDSASPMASLADSLIWRSLDRRPGKTNGRPPAIYRSSAARALEPPPPETARRQDRETWRKIADGEARDLPADTGDELRAAYAMSDEDLWQTLSQRERDDAYELHDLDTEGTTHHG